MDQVERLEGPTGRNGETALLEAGRGHVDTAALGQQMLKLGLVSESQLQEGFDEVGHRIVSRRRPNALAGATSASAAAIRTAVVTRTAAEIAAVTGAAAKTGTRAATAVTATGAERQ